MQTDYIRISLTQKAVIILDNITLRKVEPVKDLTFVVNDALGRVEVLGDLFIAHQSSSAEAENPAGNAVYREHYPSTEKVEMPVFFRFN